MTSVGSSRWMRARISGRCSTRRTVWFCSTSRAANWAPVRPPPAMTTFTSGLRRSVETSAQPFDALERGTHLDDVSLLQDGLGVGQRGAAGAGVRHAADAFAPQV